MRFTLQTSLCLIFFALLWTSCSKKAIEPIVDPVEPEEPAPPLPEEPDSSYYVFGMTKSQTRFKIEKGVEPNNLSDAEVEQYFANRRDFFQPTEILVTKDSTFITKSNLTEKYKSVWKNGDKELYILTGIDGTEKLLGKLTEDKLLQIDVAFSRQIQSSGSRSLVVLDQDYSSNPFDKSLHLGKTGNSAYGVAEVLLYKEKETK